MTAHYSRLLCWLFFFILFLCCFFFAYQSGKSKRVLCSLSLLVDGDGGVYVKRALMLMMLILPLMEYISGLFPIFCTSSLVIAAVRRFFFRCYCCCYFNRNTSFVCYCTLRSVINREAKKSKCWLDFYFRLSLFDSHVLYGDLDSYRCMVVLLIQWLVVICNERREKKTEVHSISQMWS